MFRFLPKQYIKICCRYYFNRHVKTHKFLPPPVKTSVDPTKLPEPTKIDQPTIELLERLSLVGFESEKGIQVVEDAIRFADQILEVNTGDVKPLFTVLEDESLYLREDEVEPDATAQDILLNSQCTFEDYFVTPVGNIEYIPEKKLRNYQEEFVKEEQEEEVVQN